VHVHIFVIILFLNLLTEVPLFGTHPPMLPTLLFEILNVSK